MQAPLKQRYKDDAGRRAHHLPRRGHPRADDIACTVRPGMASVTAGLHEAAGGTGELACSADMLLEALVGCAGVTLRAVATAMGVTSAAGGSSPRACGTRAARWASTAACRSG